ncbi:hypothetical protein P7D22_11975 [Lichenihabitans sp. Uapishka_5]|uniref:hypothetical protein n=1 Tax=Lichenihabitans sp. Uapishka_5 TaxID=3037302 RepID=UPI0029E812A0|nr:hypothetical protein [Lichenihabitans sp. Uapishka_5]MDX7951888.1 hypothetical protein [Lichenihabitans sp. Uapishka_5]
MFTTTENTDDRFDAADERRAALAYVSEAFAEATLDGIEDVCFAQAALFTALESMVRNFGEEPVATFAEGLAERVRQGEFSIAGRH